MKFLLSLCVFIQVWSADAGVTHSPPTDLLWKSQATWGTGNDIITTLINADSEVMTPMKGYVCRQPHVISCSLFFELERCSWICLNNLSWLPVCRRWPQEVQPRLRWSWRMEMKKRKWNKRWVNLFFFPGVFLWRLGKLRFISTFLFLSVTLFLTQICVTLCWWSLMAWNYP